MAFTWRVVVAWCLVLTFGAASRVVALGGEGQGQPAAPQGPTRADILRGEYGPLRANNDLLSYDLSVRVDPDRKFISGRNTIRFRMLKDDSRIQLDLFENLAVDKIQFGGRELKYERELGTVYVEFPEPLKKGREYAIDVLLLRQSDRDRPVRWHHLQEGQRRESPGSTPRASTSVRASGGRTRTSIATRSRRCA